MGVMDLDNIDALWNIRRIPWVLYTLKPRYFKMVDVPVSNMYPTLIRIGIVSGD